MDNGLRIENGEVLLHEGGSSIGSTDKRIFSALEVDAIRMVVDDEIKKANHLSEKQANRIAKDIEDRIADAFTGDTGTDDSIY